MDKFSNKKEDTALLGKAGLSAHFSLAVCTLLFMINFMDRSVLSAVLEPMKIDLGLSDTQAGLLQTCFFISLAIMSAPVAFLVDRWSRKKAIGIMAFLWSIFTCLTGFGRTFLHVVTARMLVAVGEAGFSSGSIALITASYPKALRGRIVGIFNLGLPVGSALGVIIGGYLSVNYGGWRTPFYIFAIPGIVLGVAAFFLRDYKTETKESSKVSQPGFFKTARILFSIPSLRWNYLGYAMLNACFTALFAWFPALIIRISGMSEDKAGGLMALVLVGSAIGMISGGFLADWWQRRNKRAMLLLPALATLTGAIVLLIALYLFTLKMMVLTFILIIIQGAICTLGVAAQQSATQDVVPARLKGMSFGLAMFMMYFGGGWSPVVIGAVSDALGGGSQGLLVGFASIGISTLVLASICYYRGSRYYEKDVLQAEKLA
ncbi:MAG: MFS transporter [Desulfobacula sp.]|nr:MFS transporter [Desulfobacula sp.]